MGAGVTTATSGVQHAWRVVLASGLALWGASTVTLVATDDAILLPAVVLLGSFLVPVTSIFWLLEHRHHTTLSPARLLTAFFAAGVLGLLAAAALETWLLPSRLAPNLWVGLIEEAVKAIGLVAVARGLPRYPVRDGVILGATVGLGFGAFESSGYALSYGVHGGAFSPRDLISEELLRAAIAPVGHGVWTGLIGAALFGAARNGRLRLGAGVVGAYLAVSVLHALWDASSNAGVIVTVLVAGDSIQRQALRDGSLPAPSSLDQQVLLGAVQWTIMGLVALVGVLLLRRRWVLAAGAPPAAAGR